MLNLAALRRVSGLTQKEVSALLLLHTGENYGIEAISRHESQNESTHRMPPPHVMKAYAVVYKVTVRDLYSELCPEDDLLNVVAQQRGLIQNDG